MEAQVEGFRATCPHCGHHEFVVTPSENVQNADKMLAFVLCGDVNCQHLISVLPGDAAWSVLPGSPAWYNRD